MRVNYNGRTYRVTQRDKQLDGTVAIMRVRPHPATFKEQVAIMQLADRFQRQRADQRFLQACGIVGDWAST